MLPYLCAALCWVSVLTAPTTTTTNTTTTTSIDLLMPGVQPQKPDTYLCRSFDTTDMKPYITEFIPNANMEIAHHILLYGCAEPGSDKEIWNCGEMQSADSDYESAPVCASGAKILYAWAMDAPSLKLPKDVAFKVGPDTGVKKLAMQVHYKNVTSFLPPENKKDSSGLTLVTTDEPKGKRAGVFLMVTGGTIPADNVEYLEAACPYPDSGLEIHPFAYRTHAHSLGRVISGYRVRDGQWTEIGRKDPRKPQMFYNTTTPDLTLKKGDIMAARCTMENNLNHDVSVGATQNDEMCNFYIMYYVGGDRLLSRDQCFTPGGPSWYLADYPDQRALNLEAMPSTASQVPGTGHVLRATTQAAEENMDPEGWDIKDAVQEEGEDDDPVLDEMLDDYIAQLDPAEVEALLYQTQRRLNDANGYYYVDDTK